MFRVAVQSARSGTKPRGKGGERFPLQASEGQGAAAGCRALKLALERGRCRRFREMADVGFRGQTCNRSRRRLRPWRTDECVRRAIPAGGFGSVTERKALERHPPKVQRHHECRSRRGRADNRGGKHPRGMSELNPCLPSFRRSPASRGCAFMLPLLKISPSFRKSALIYSEISALLFKQMIPYFLKSSLTYERHECVLWHN